jgi:hypothetical protein
MVEFNFDEGSIAEKNILKPDAVGYKLIISVKLIYIFFQVLDERIFKIPSLNCCDPTIA